MRRITQLDEHSFAEIDADVFGIMRNWVRERPIDICCFRDSWIRLLKAGSAAVFVTSEDADVTGAIGCLAFIEPTDGIKTATVGFWLVEPDANFMTGVSLFSAYEAWARQAGVARLIGVKCHEAIADMDGFLKRNGYSPCEIRYSKMI